EGYLIESPTLSSALTIAGFSQQAAANLTTEGTPKVLNQGAPVNQPSGVIIPGGAWPNDARCGVWVCDDRFTYRGNLGTGQTWTQALNETLCGLTKDTNNY